MLKVTLNKKVIIRLLSLFLIITYPLDQLYTSIFPNISIPSPFKFLFFFYLFIQVFSYDLKYIRRVKVILQILFALIIWSLISVLWAEVSYMDALKYSFKMLVLWSFLVVAISNLSKDNNALKKIIFYWLIISGLVSVFSLLGYFSPESASSVGRLSFNNIGLNAIAISMGYIFILASNSFHLYENEKVKRCIIYICLILIFLLILKLGTRSVLWGLVLAFILPNFIYLKKKYIIRVLVILSAFIYAFFYLINSGYIQGRAAMRLLSFSSDTFTNNSRVELFYKGFEWWTNNILGTGGGNESYAYIQMGTKNLEAHNSFMSALIQFGVPGIILLLLVVFIIYFKIYLINDKRQKILFFSLFVFFVMQLVKGSFIQTRLFWQPLTILLLMLESFKIQRNNNEKINTNSSMDST